MPKPVIGRPIPLTTGERRIVIDALEHARGYWEGLMMHASDKQDRYLAKLRLRQSRRIIAKLQRPLPIPEDI